MKMLLHLSTNPLMRQIFRPTCRISGQEILGNGRAKGGNTRRPEMKMTVVGLTLCTVGLLALVLGCGKSEKTLTSSKIEAVKLMVERAAKGDRKGLEDSFLPKECILQMLTASPETLTAERRNEIEEEYARGRTELVEGFLQLLRGKDPRNLRYEDRGLEGFTKSELKGMEKRGFLQKDDAADIRVILDEEESVNVRVFRCGGRWYFTDAS